jgi:hypothetical protein
MQTWEYQPPAHWAALLTQTITAQAFALHTGSCAECQSLMQNLQPVEVLVSVQDLHLGWRRVTCAECGHSESRLAIVRGPDRLEYQTHPVC